MSGVVERPLVAKPEQQEKVEKKLDKLQMF